MLEVAIPRINQASSSSFEVHRLRKILREKITPTYHQGDFEEDNVIYSNLVIEGNANIAFANDCVILAKGNVDISFATNCTIFSYKKVTISHSRNVVVVAARGIEISHDNSLVGEQTVGRSLLITGNSPLRISHARNSIYFGADPAQIEISFSSGESGALPSSLFQ